MSAKLRPLQPARIAIFRALQLGDMLVAVPALRAIRGRYPEAEITLIGLPWAEWFVERFGAYIDRFVEFPGWPGITEASYEYRRTSTFLREQRRYGYDLAIQLHGSGKHSNAFVAALGAGLTAGYHVLDTSAKPDICAPYPEGDPEILRGLGIAGLLGASAAEPELEFPLTPEDEREAARLLGPGLDQAAPLIGVHPGASAPSRRWPAERFAAVADHLAREHGVRIILTGGPDEEAIAGRVAGLMTSPVTNLAGRTSIGGLAALIDRLDLFISNDTGPAHIACARKTPSVVIFGPADPKRWAPLNSDLHRVVRHPVPCSPCRHRECPIDHRCLQWIAAADVLAVADELVAREKVA